MQGSLGCCTLAEVGLEQGPGVPWTTKSLTEESNVLRLLCGGLRHRLDHARQIITTAATPFIAHSLFA
jgi:hypothetical protein